jgi:hypothetical protein
MIVGDFPHTACGSIVYKFVPTSLFLSYLNFGFRSFLITSCWYHAYVGQAFVLICSWKIQLQINEDED